MLKTSGLVPFGICLLGYLGFVSNFGFRASSFPCVGMARGGPNVFVTCCTDGYRPVLFLLEKLRDQ